MDFCSADFLLTRGHDGERETTATCFLETQKKRLERENLFCGEIQRVGHLRVVFVQKSEEIATHTYGMKKSLHTYDLGTTYKF